MTAAGKRHLATTSRGTAASPALGAARLPGDPLPDTDTGGAGEDGAVSHNLNGQRLGRKGRDTRERILLAANRLLYCEIGDTPISLSSVAREASLGMTSLYTYFSDLTEVLLAVLDPVMASAEDVYLGPLRTRWIDADLGDRCYQFVGNYQAFWKKHSRLLHLRNAMSHQQNPRMVRQRIKSTQPIIGLLAWQMDGDPQAPRSPAFAMANVLMIGIERSTTIWTDDELPVRIAHDIQHDDAHFLRPSARLLEMAIRDVRGRSTV